MFLEMAYLCSYVVSKKRRVNLICFGGWSVSKSPRQQFNKATWNQFGQGCYLKPLASQLKSLAHSFLVFREESRGMHYGTAHSIWHRARCVATNSWISQMSCRAFFGKSRRLKDTLQGTDKSYTCCSITKRPNLKCSKVLKTARWRWENSVPYGVQKWTIWCCLTDDGEYAIQNF